MMMFPKWKTMFLSVFLKNVRRKIVKHKFFFFDQFFVSWKSNNKEGKHNDSTHKERTNREEVKRKNKENQSLFKGFFLGQKQRDTRYVHKEDIERRMICLNFLTKQNEFFLRGPKRRLIKENQEK